MRVRLYSHAGQGTGYGRAANELAMSLLAAGVDLSLVRMAPQENLSFPGVYEALAGRVIPERYDGSLDVAIVHTLPGDCHRVLEMVSPPYKAAIAYTTWEALTTPREIEDSLRFFKQVWVPSSSNAKAFALRGNLHPYVVPHAFDLSTLRERNAVMLPTERKDFGRAFRFYYIGAWTKRKNPVGLIQAFAHAFTASDAVQLRLHCPGADVHMLACAIGELGIAPELVPDIKISTERFTDQEIQTLHRSHDVFVTASHGEAWNLPAFDAFLAGSHIIYPAGQGTDDFLRGTSAQSYTCNRGIASVDVGRLVIDGREIKTTSTGAQGLSAKAAWLEPDLLQLAFYMRIAYDDKIRRLSGGEPEMFSYETVGELARGYLETALQKQPRA